MDMLKIWIINICSTVLFITAVELILPNNTIKKYAKFVLGLILMTVVINPIFKVADKNKENLTWNIEKSEKYLVDFEKNKKEYKNKNMDSTMENFKKNLQDKIMESLLTKYPEDKFEVGVLLESNEEKFSIKGLEVKAYDKNVNKVKKVELNGVKDDNTKSSLDTAKDKEIKTYLSSILNIEEKSIKIIR